MTIDLLIPFGILLVLVIYLIYTRNSFENSMLKTYDEKFKSWKEHSIKEVEEVSAKELVGLVFKKDGKINIEVFEENIKDRLDRGKFNTKVK